MSDDSFFREVEEELRSDKLKSAWERFGTYIIGGAVLVVLAVAGNTAWNWWAESRATASGDRFRQALELASEGQTDEARQALAALSEDGFGEYPVLARMRAATLQDDPQAAVEAFDTIAADTSVPPALRDVARLRAAYILVDTGSYTDVAERADALSSDTNPMRHGAREALGLAAWKAGDMAEAKRFFDAIIADDTAPPPTRQRAGVMIDLIRATGEVDEA